MGSYQVKLPLVPDLSETDLGKPLAQASPRPAAVIGRLVVARYVQGCPWLTADVQKDPSVPALRAQAQALGIPDGWFAYLLQGKMADQIDAFLDHARACGLLTPKNQWLPALPPIADVEVECDAKKPRKAPKSWVDPIVGAKWAAQVHDWLVTIEQVCGVRPWIYTARYQWACLLDGDGKPPSWTQDYLYWLKYYPYEDKVDGLTEFPASALPTGITQDMVLWWQYAQDGRSQGHDYNDLNVPTQAGLAWLAQHAAGSVIPPVEPPVEPPVPPASDDWQKLYNQVAAELNRKTHALEEIQQILNGLKVQ